MATLVLLVDLRADGTNTIRSVLTHMYDRKQESPLRHDGVVQLSDRLFAFDRTKAHGALVQVAAALEQKRWPYLLAQIDSASSLVSGTPRAEVASLLAGAGVQFAPQQP